MQLIHPKLCGTIAPYGTDILQNLGDRDGLTPISVSVGSFEVQSARVTEATPASRRVCRTPVWDAVEIGNALLNPCARSLYISKCLHIKSRDRRSTEVRSSTFEASYPTSRGPRNKATSSRQAGIGLSKMPICSRPYAIKRLKSCEFCDRNSSHALMSTPPHVHAVFTELWNDSRIHVIF